jgi:hypothetical protein
LFNEQEGAEEELENNNEDAPDDVVGAEVEDKEQEKKGTRSENIKVYEGSSSVGQNRIVWVENRTEHTRALDCSLSARKIGLQILFNFNETSTNKQFVTGEANVQ